MIRVGPRTIKFTYFALISYLAGKNHKFGRIYIGVWTYKLKIFIGSFNIRTISDSCQ